MGASINKVMVQGRLGADPEVRYTPNGAATATITLATSERWRDKTSDEMKENTEWHRVVLWNKPAEVVGEYCRKGDELFVEGSLQTRKWTDTAGVERYVTEIKASHFAFGEKGPNNKGQQQGQGQGQPQQPRGQSQGAAPRTNQQNQPANQGGNGGNQQPPMDFDDDIPF